MQEAVYMPNSRIVPLALLIIVLIGCTDDPLAADEGSTAPSTRAAQSQESALVPDLEGQWLWEEAVELTGPSDLVMALFGLAEAEGPVMHISCLTGGSLEFAQSGASFTGEATQSAECETRHGQIASQHPFPPTFDIAGEIVGRAVQFEALVGEGFHCPYRGSLTLAGGTAISLNATGRCDTPLPVNPNVTKSIYFRASRS